MITRPLGVLRPEFPDLREPRQWQSRVDQEVKRARALEDLARDPGIRGLIDSMTDGDCVD